MKKEIQKKTYSEDYVGAILEEIRGDFKVFGERQDMLIDRMGLVEKKVDILQDDMVEVKFELNVVKSELNEVKNDLNVVKGDLNTVKGDLGEVKHDLNVVKNDLGEVKTVLKKKVKEDEKLEKRTVKLEKLVFSKMA